MSSLNQKSSVCRSVAGDVGQPAIAYYNYHSLPVPSSGIDSLLKFITSQLSLTLLSLFFCCDPATTPADVLDHLDKLPNCTVLNIPSSGDFDLESSKSAQRMAATLDAGQLILISDEGNFEVLLKRLPDWELVIFHSSDMDPGFFDYASKTVELSIMPAVFEDVVDHHHAGWKPSKAVERLNLAAIRMDLADINKTLRNMLKRLYSQKTDNKGGDKPEEMGKTISYDHLGSSKTSEVDIETEKSEPKPQYRGNGWDDFPELDASMLGKTNGWDEVDRELEKERAQVNPFAVKNNSFGGQQPQQLLAYDDSVSISSSKANVALVPPSSPYNQDLYDNRALIRTENICNGFALKGSGPLFEKQQGCGFGGRRNKKDEANPFAAGSLARGPSKPAFIKPKYQCPQWENTTHRMDPFCNLWHPAKQCQFFPNCRLTAAECCYAHPFCMGGNCECEPGEKDLRLNHYMPSQNERE